jgi:hypothetical protein
MMAGSSRERGEILLARVSIDQLDSRLDKKTYFSVEKTRFSAVLPRNAPFYRKNYCCDWRQNGPINSTEKKMLYIEQLTLLLASISLEANY